jgi:hypothetical protein
MQNKIYLCLLGLVLMITPDLLSAQMSNCSTQVQRLKVLPESSHHGMYGMDVELFPDTIWFGNCLFQYEFEKL